MVASCSICLEEDEMPFTQLDCSHEFHTSCLRSYLKTIRENVSVSTTVAFICPLCRAAIGAAIVSDLEREVRNLHFEYILSETFSTDPAFGIRVVVGHHNEIVRRSERMLVGDLLSHVSYVNSVCLVLDMEVTVRDPEQQFDVWVEGAETRIRISNVFQVGTTAIDQRSTPASQRPAPERPPATVRNRLLRRDRILQRRCEVLRRAYERSRQLLTRLRNLVARREEEMLALHTRYNDSINEWQNFHLNSIRYW